MNRSELVRAVAERAGSDETAARRHLDAVVETVMERVSAGERVTVTGFGTFERVSRVARSARNPRTGLAVEVPAAEVPRFRSGQTFRNRVAQSGPTAVGEPVVAAAAVSETAVSVVVEPAPAKKPKAAKTTKNARTGGKNGKNEKRDKKSAAPKKAPKRAKAGKVELVSKKRPGKAKARAKAAK